MRRVLAGLLLLATIITPLPAVADATACTEALGAESMRAVDRAVKAGAVKLYIDSLDGMDQPTNRIFFASYLAHMLGWEPDPAWNDQHPFSDVPRDNWVGGRIAMLHAAGIIRGHGNGLFGPYQVLRAEDARVIVARTLRLAPDPTPDTAADLLRKAGIDPDFTCGSELVTGYQSWVLVDRMLSVAIQQRRVDPAKVWPATTTTTEGLVTCHTINAEDFMGHLERLRTAKLAKVGKGPPPYEGADDPIHRGEYAYLIARLLGWEEAGQAYTGPNPFSDAADHWTGGAIALLRQAGILDAQPGAPFHPNAPLTVAEAKLWLARALRAAPDVTLANADGALKQLGIDPHVTCRGDEQLMTYAQGWVLLDRVDSVAWYARWPKQ